MQNIKFCGLSLIMILTTTLAAGAGEIHDVVREGDRSRTEVLLAENPTLVGAADDRGRTPLHLAAAGGYMDIIRLLLDSGADLETQDSRGNTPLLSAVSANDSATVAFLIDRGADSTAVHSQSGSLIDHAFRIECMRGWSGITSLLVSYGMFFDPNHIDAFGDHRVFNSAWFGHTEMLKFLLQFEPNLNVVRGDNQLTPLIDVINRVNSDAARLLIEHGAEVNISDKNGDPPIRYAVDRGVRGAVLPLIEAGADVRFVEKTHGRSLLHLAAIHGYKEIAAALVTHGCAVDPQDHHGKTPLFYAGKYGNKALADLLIANGAVRHTGMEENYGKSPHLIQPPPPGNAVVWYLIRRGWAVKTANHLLIFDNDSYITRPTEPSLANGSVTLDEIREQNIFSLFSNHHGRDEYRFDYMHTIADSLENVTYIHDRDNAWRGDGGIDYLGSYEAKNFGDVRVFTLRPIGVGGMPMMGYLCQLDDLSVYYHGPFTSDAESYRQTVDSLRQHAETIDLALLPAPAANEHSAADLRYFLEQLKPQAVCFLAFKDQIPPLEEITEKISSWGFGTPIFCAENPGDKFMYRKRH